MPSLELDRNSHAVVVNGQGQYSIWPTGRQVPAGWRAVGKNGSKAACLRYIDEVWTDLVPCRLQPAPDQCNASGLHTALPAAHDALPAAHSAPATKNERTAKGMVGPESPTEHALALIWREVLNLEHIGIDDDFFALGGHSPAAMRMVSQVRAVLMCEVAPHALLEAPTIRQLARTIGERPAHTQPLAVASLHATPQGGSMPLSYAQERVWLLEKLSATGASRYLQTVLHLRGDLDPERLQRSLSEVVRRQHMLRTRIEEVDGEVGQIIDAPETFRMERMDLSQPGRERHDPDAWRSSDAQPTHAVNGAAAPLFRAQLIKDRVNDHRLLLEMHPIVADDCSVDVVIAEITELYSAYTVDRPPVLPTLALQYADYATWQRRCFDGNAPMRSVGYWKARLSGAPDAIDLPLDRPRPPVQTGRAAVVSFTLPAGLSAQLGLLSRQENATLYMTLLAAFSLLLSRYSGQTDIVVGATTSDRQHREFDGLVGHFANLLPIRIDLSGDPEFRALVARVKDAAGGAYAHQDLPFAKLVHELQPVRDVSRHPILQVELTLQSTLSDAADLAGVKMARMPVADVTSRLDLAWCLHETACGLHGSVSFATDLFDRDTVQRMVDQFGRVLEEVVLHPAQRISQIRLLTADERQRLLVDWNDTASDSLPDWCLQTLFHAQVAEAPDAIALTFEDKHMTYAELDRRANRLAHYLQGCGVGPDVVVALFAERSFDMVVALWAILKAGGAYLPLDPEYPKESLEYMVASSGVTFVVTQSWLIGRLPRHAAQVVLVDKQFPSHLRDPIATAPHSDATPANLAYVIYTSGSTGRPKGVMIPHAGIVNRLLWMDQVYCLTPNDCVLQKTPLSFDVSVWEILWPLISGARLVLAKPGGHMDPLYLVSLIVAQRVTVAHCLPSILQKLLDADALGQCDCLREVLCGGEALPANTMRAAAEKSRARLSNIYGPTEASIGVTYWPCASREDGIVPIGRPIRNSKVYVLDASFEPVPVGVIGELYIGGVQLARGYLGQPGLTAERFVPNPFGTGERLYRTGDRVRWLPDGNLQFMGRIDHQVKIRGCRIEPGEIEAALLTFPGIRQAAVIVEDEGAEDAKRLVGYVVGQLGAEPVIAEIRDYLRQRLPLHMVPPVLMLLDALPLTPNGKLDRHALPLPEKHSGTAEYVAPHNLTELALQRAWESNLDTVPISIRDDFFALGGNSLRAVSVVAAINHALGVQLPVRALFDHPTIETLALALGRDGTPQPYCALVPLQRNGIMRPLFCVHAAGGTAFRYMALANALGPKQPLFGLQASGLEPGEPLPSSVEAMACAYVDAIRRVQPVGPYQLLGWSFGGLVAYEIAHQLKVAGERVELLALLDTPLPRPFETTPHSHEALLALLATQLVGSAMSAVERRAISTLTDLVEAAKRRGAVSPDFSRGHAGRILAVLKNSLDIARSYRPPNLHQDLVFFRAVARSEAPRIPEEFFDWSPLLARQQITIPVACTHLEMGSPQLAPIIAAELRTRLNADGGRAARSVVR